MGKRAYRRVCWRLLVDGCQEGGGGHAWNLDRITGLAYVLQCEECRYLDQKGRFTESYEVPYAKKRIVIEAYLY